MEKEKYFNKNESESERYLEIMGQFKKITYGRVLPPIENYNKLVQAYLEGKLESNLPKQKPFQTRGGLFWKLLEEEKERGIKYAIDAMKAIGNRNLKLDVYTKMNKKDTEKDIFVDTGIRLPKKTRRGKRRN
jgi:hypothetical protein